MQVQQNLVLLDDDNRREVLQSLVMNDGPGQCCIQETFYLQWNAFILERFDGFWVDDLCAVVSHFNDFVVIQFADEAGGGEKFGVGIVSATKQFLLS